MVKCFCRLFKISAAEHRKIARSRFLVLSLVTVEKPDTEGSDAMHSDNTRDALSPARYSTGREIQGCESRHQVQNEPPVSSVAGRNVATTIRINIYLIY